MKLYQGRLGLIGALALAGTAYAQVPASNDSSDGNLNTGTGTLALGGPAATNGGQGNTASGYQALRNNATGNSNTAAGVNALYSNTSGSENTAAGGQALFLNTTGNDNTAAGLQALYSNTTGSSNTAAGTGALQFNTTGKNNTATGDSALILNTTGSNNTATGYNALYANKAGKQNTAVGQSALHGNTSGSNNIGIGYQGGLHLTTGSNNIDIGNTGVAGEPNTIRIGATQTVTYIAGIVGTNVTGNAVVITSAGQLGVKGSSERFKKDIATMGAASEKLERLRPVTFHYKSDATGSLEYGLIAEEVAKVYPELVIRDQSGRIHGVRYDELAPMLLNEAQQQKHKIDSQDAEIHELKQQMAELKALNQDTQAVLQKLQSKDELMTRR